MLAFRKTMICIAALALLAWVLVVLICSGSAEGNDTSHAVSVNAGDDETASIPDFDGDGTIGFSDLLLFAGAFGSSRGDSQYEARFDLNGDGSVGFADLLIFAGVFGSRVPPSGGGGGGSSPDLIVESLSVDDNTLTAGQSLTLRATVRNQGNASSGATTLRYYRSSTATISTDDVEVGTDAVSGLVAGGTSAESIGLNAPSDAGIYYYGACVDGVSGESDSDNNCSTGVRVVVAAHEPSGPTYTDLKAPQGIALDVAAGKMYWTDFVAHKIQRANLDGSNVETLVDAGSELRRPQGIALDVAAGKMYWTDAFTDKIQRANLDGSNVQDLVTTGLDDPNDIALDVAAGKMYWTDMGEDRVIQRANLDGSNVQDLVTTGLVLPYCIALDVAAGKMYWTNDVARPSKIQRANLDGSQVETLVEQPYGNVYVLALDVPAGKMYWTGPFIQRANLDGSQVEILVRGGLRSPLGIALDVSGGKMYWTDYGTTKIKRANLDGSNVETLVEPPPPDAGYEDTPPQLFLDYGLPQPDGGSVVKTGPISQARIRLGEELTLSVRVKCDDGREYSAGRYDAPCFTEADQVTYRSSAPSAATVTLGYTDYFVHQAAGIVRGVGLGSATITATFKGRDAAPVTVEVVSASPIAERVTMDRPDDISGPQIHFVYAVPIGQEDRNYDRTGDIAVIADMMQSWLQVQAGMTWRLDTYNGQLDVSYLPIQIQLEARAGIMSALSKALQAQQQRHPQKIYAVFLESTWGGMARDKIAWTGVPGPYHELIAGTAIHEILHTLGAAPPCAPNADDYAHVSDGGGRDIMGGTAGSVGGGPDWVSVLDWGRDDYFGHGRSDCLDVADSPYWKTE